MLGVVIYVLSLVGLFVDSYRDYAATGEVAIVYGNKVELSGLPSKRLIARLKSAHIWGQIRNYS